ncbi:MAG: hypothetical protein AB1489_39220 [Acidobacteriota bacterium]
MKTYKTTIGRIEIHQCTDNSEVVGKIIQRVYRSEPYCWLFFTDGTMAAICRVACEVTDYNGVQIDPFDEISLGWVSEQQAREYLAEQEKVKEEEREKQKRLEDLHKKHGDKIFSWLASPGNEVRED